jgi:hypothetical protein
MPPKHRQPNAPRPKPAGNVYKALVDLPHDGSNPVTDGRDEKIDGSDGKSAGNALIRVFTAGTPAAAPPSQIPTDENDNNTVIIANLHESIEMHYKNEARLYKIEERVIGLSTNQHQHFEDLNSKMDDLLQKMDAAWTENTALREAYRASREETAVLKAAVDTLTKKLDENIATTMPPSPETATSSSAMEEMTMQLSHVQHDIQDVLNAVCNPPGKRKRRTSNQNTEPTTPTNRQPATNKQRDASPEHSLMHSQHATSAAQDALDALMRKYPPRPLAITSTEAITDPLPNSNTVQDTTLPDAPTTTAPVESDGWTTVKGKATQKKRRNDKADNKWTAKTANNTPTTKNGGRGKNTYQPRTNTPSAKKTWAEVVKSGGINVQIVLGNGNLGLTTPTARRGERRGGVARRLAKKEEDGERGAKRRGNDGPEEINHGGNKGGHIRKDGRGRAEERGEPGAAAPVQAGHLEQ